MFELLRDIAKPDVMAAYASLTGDTPAQRVTPILNVSDFDASVQWFRALGWLYAVPLMLFLIAQGRGYYLAPAYSILYAAGAVWIDA